MTEIKKQTIDELLKERGTTHGDYSAHAGVTQSLKRVMKNSPNWDTLPDIIKETLEMHAHKVGRILTGNPFVADHYDDICGYARLITQRTVDKLGMTPEAARVAVAYADPTWPTAHVVRDSHGESVGTHVYKQVPAEDVDADVEPAAGEAEAVPYVPRAVPTRDEAVGEISTLTGDALALRPYDNHTVVMLRDGRMMYLAAVPYGEGPALAFEVKLLPGLRVKQTKAAVKLPVVGGTSRQTGDVVARVFVPSGVEMIIGDAKKAEPKVDHNAEHERRVAVVLHAVKQGRRVKDLYEYVGRQLSITKRDARLLCSSLGYKVKRT